MSIIEDGTTEVGRPPAVDGEDRLTALFAKAMLIRGVEQRLLSLFSEGKLAGTVHTCIGQEWTGVAIAEALRERDIVLSTHRCHGHYLARTGDVEGLLAEVMGRPGGMCAGRGGSQHIHRPGFYSNGVQGGTMPIGAGLAWMQKMAGTGDITVVFIGDGTLGEGAVYETFNIASKWGLPLLVVLENNRYSQSTAQGETLAGDICARAGAFGIERARADTWDVEALLAQVGESVGYVRSACRPFFLQIDTYRLMAHSKGDDGREPAEIEAHWRRDPIARWKARRPADALLIEKGLSERIEAVVAAAGRVEQAAVAPVRAGATVGRRVAWTRTRVAEPERIVNLIHASLRRNMARDGRVVLIGEDIEGPYGGAFKVTKGLSQEFPGRVRNMPISEAAIVGMGNGVALAGGRPVCEIMFGDFLTLAFDQFINHAAKFRYMYNEQVTVPVIVRTPMGGKRGYGATHSQSIEKHFLGIPDTQVLAIHPRFDPGVIYDRLLETVDRPTLVVENKLLYGARVNDQVADGFVLQHDDQPFPTTRIAPLGKAADVTVLCYGGTLPDVEKAVEELFDEHEIACEVICPTRIYPLDLAPVLESVGRTGRLVIVEEGQGFAAFGSEVVAQVAEVAPGALRQVRRVCAAAHAIPASSALEKHALPGVGQIVEAVRGVCGGANE